MMVQHTDIMLDSLNYQNKKLTCSTYFWIACTHISRGL